VVDRLVLRLERGNERGISDENFAAMSLAKGGVSGSQREGC